MSKKKKKGGRTIQEIGLEKQKYNGVNLVDEKQQNKFIETTLGKTINVALDLGIRFLLPDLIEDQVIEIKNELLKNGLKDGINKAIDTAINFGKSTLGIVTGNFENISQVQTAIKNGGIIDSISSSLDFVLNKTVTNHMLPSNIGKIIKQGKNVILDNISKNIQNEFERQLDSIEKVDKYNQNWKKYYKEKDFDGMQREYDKIKEKMKDLIPIENTLKETRTIENLHNLIKNKGKTFDLTEQEIELANKLIV